ncbi:phosphate/phosphite/phosphonate ABC transporter substrate-binding protein [Oceanicoccus sp. KOV_DT_Chl]|uniref:phosphate/phosphite/phosphonate ABC transporter substrate-binding protein n=1 Tax=Oceanicoccus sp. KOV_DT_Chl TaxID=1904639 RepID=UPI000C7A12A4|nr:PhnD/SsuA/transferrin family substrate-binding protein [Oceanicoccus sp. KOV_DT_Chl]
MIRLIATIFFCFSLHSVVAAEKASLTIAYYPYLNPDSIQTQAEQLKTLLERDLAVDIKIYVGGSYEDFLRAVCHQQFDIVFSPSHFAAFFIDKCQYQPLVRSTAKVQPILVSNAKNPIKNVDELVAKKLTLVNELSLVSMAGLSLIKQQLGADFAKVSLVERLWNDRTLFSVISGEVDAAVIPLAVVNYMPLSVREKLYTFPLGPTLNPDLVLFSMAAVNSDNYVVQNLKENLVIY